MEIKSLQDIFDRALFAFTETVDNLKEPLTEEAKVSEYISGAQELISQSTSLLLKLEINKEQLTSNTRTQAGLMGNGHPNGNTVVRIELPKLPIPEFSGKFWHWDSFWELFNATVHSLPLSDLQKFNYLLRALKGEAREPIARFQLEYWNTRNTLLRDQRKLYDQLFAITAQLESKGESLDSPWLLSKILSKFSEAIQRSTLKEKVSLPPTEIWTLQRLMSTLDFVIKQEEEIEQHLPRKKERAELPQKVSKEANLQLRKRSPFCFYCDSKEHWSIGCTKITAPKARLEHLKKNNRCIRCGSKSHALSECRSKGCMNCGKKHHTSTCFKTDSGKQTAQPNRKKEEKQRSSHTRQNFMMCEDDTECLSDTSPSLTAMRVEDTSHQPRNGEIFLLTGKIQAMHPNTQKLITFQILLDTGADRSFIDTELARQLDLPCNGKITMMLRTFGAETAKEIQCTDTCLSVWDAEGNQHKLRVYTHANLTKNFNRGKLDEKDLQFIRRNRIKLSLPQESGTGKAKGCTQSDSWKQKESTR